MNTQIKFSAFVLTLCFQLISTFVSAQDIIDIVDPYEMKVSRSKDADTFYFSQNATTALAAKQKLDTLRTYDVFLEERPTPFGTAYMCNGNEVNKNILNTKNSGMLQVPVNHACCIHMTTKIN